MQQYDANGQPITQEINQAQGLDVNKIKEILSILNIYNIQPQEEGGNMPSDDNFGSNLVSGHLRPQRPRQQIPPAWERKITIGEHGDYFSRLRLQVKKPTLQYPDASIFLSLGNGNSTAFTRISLDDIKQIALLIAQSLEEIPVIQGQLESVTTASIDQNAQFQNVVKALMDAAKNGKTEQEQE